MTTPSNAELLRLIRRLQRARQRFIEAAQVLAPATLDSCVDDTGWTTRRLVEFCRAQERWHFSRMLNFFDSDVKIYDSLAASLDHQTPATTEPTLARECAEIWLAGRETEMWVDVLLEQDINAVRHASAGWPQGGWSIREVFTRVTNLYSEKAKILAKMSKGRPA